MWKVIIIYHLVTQRLIDWVQGYISKIRIHRNVSGSLPNAMVFFLRFFVRKLLHRVIKTKLSGEEDFKRCWFIFLSLSFMILTMGDKESYPSLSVFGKVRNKGTYTLGKADCRPSFDRVSSIFDGVLSCAHINDLKWMGSLAKPLFKSDGYALISASACFVISLLLIFSGMKRTPNKSVSSL